MSNLILVQQNCAPFVEDLIFSKYWKVAFRWGVFKLNFLSIWILFLGQINNLFWLRSFLKCTLLKGLCIQLTCRYNALWFRLLASQYDVGCICCWVEFYRISRYWDVLRLLRCRVPLVLLSGVDIGCVVEELVLCHPLVRSTTIVLNRNLLSCWTSCETSKITCHK
jgi:hypothetical protein